MSRKKLAPKTWRKLYTWESPDWMRLSVYLRGLAAILLKYAEDDGHLVVADEEMITSLAARIGARPGDRRTLKRDVDALLADGYLVIADRYLCIRNMTRFQAGGEDTHPEQDRVDAAPAPRERGARTTRVQRESDASTTREPREHDATATREQRESDVSATRVRRECNARTEVSAENDSGQSLAYTGARSERRGEENRVEQSREESARDASNHPSDGSPKPTGPRLILPTSRPPSGPESARILAELQAHPVLAPVADAVISDVIAGRANAAMRRVEWVIDAIREFAADQTIAAGKGRALLPDELGKKLRAYCDHAKPPRVDLAAGPAPSAAQDAPRKLFSAADLPPAEPPPPGAKEALAAAIAGFGRGTVAGQVPRRMP